VLNFIYLQVKTNLYKKKWIALSRHTQLLIKSNT
jgi:hypothetical protein